MEAPGRFEDLYRVHRGGVVSFCRRTLDSREDAEDVTQQTFLSAYSDLKDGVQPEHLRAWLYGIARNRCLEVIRARHRAVAALDPSIQDVEEAIECRAELRAALEAMKQLPYPQRMALGLFELGQLRQAEIARLLGCKPQRVKALVFQARSTLLADREARET